jgi:hypothetical protein
MLRCLDDGGERPRDITIGGGGDGRGGGGVDLVVAVVPQELYGHQSAHIRLVLGPGKHAGHVFMSILRLDVGERVCVW